MFPVKERGCRMGNKKLAAIGCHPGIGHRQDSGLVVLQGIIEFILKAVAGVSTPRTSGIAPLYHKILDHPVKSYPVVVFAFFVLFIDKWTGPFCQGNKICHRERSFTVFQFYYNIAPVRLYIRKKPVTQVGILARFAAKHQCRYGQ